MWSVRLMNGSSNQWKVKPVSKPTRKPTVVGTQMMNNLVYVSGKLYQTGWAEFTSSGDRQYFVVVCIAALSHCIESVDRKVVRSGRVEARDGIHSSCRRKHVHIHETRRSWPLVPDNKTDVYILAYVFFFIIYLHTFLS